ncbi:MAG: DUF2157 domain-containing protein [Synergistaceae bacterium]|jgi:uncharacterized membrane protein|nr:DUF2157 domain-containing protein [Synergistaceae bacterium]
MERKVSEAYRRFIADESSRWVEDGLITQEQRGGILAGYSVARRLPVVVLTLGVLMIGVGILLFIASNWQAIGRVFKIFLVVGAYLASVAGAYCLERRERKAYADALIFLSGFLLLGGIALMSQIFHISGSADGLLAAWLVAFVSTFLIVRNIAIYALYETVAIVYINIAYFSAASESYQYGEYRHVFDPGTLIYPFGPTLVTVLLVAVAWWVWWGDASRDYGALPGRETLARRLFVGGATRRIFLSNFIVANWFTWICVLNSRDTTIVPYVIGILVIGALITVMAWKLDGADLDLQGLLFVGVSGMALTFQFVWDGWHSYNEGTQMNAIVSSVLLGAYLIYRIIGRRRGGGFSVFWFCALLARWYFEEFYTFMDKALFFIMGGAALIAITFAYRKWNRISQLGEQYPDGGDGDAL